MAYTLKIGTCSCENEVVVKSGSVTLGSDISAVMVNTDSLNPVFKVQGSYSGSNYCSCSEFGRFYYIENVEAIAGGHCLLHCHVDVLYTYKDAILGLTCLVDRNEYNRNGSLVDTKLPFKKNFTVYQNRVPGGNVITSSGFFKYYLMRVAY